MKVLCLSDLLLRDTKLNETFKYARFSRFISEGVQTVAEGLCNEFSVKSQREPERGGT